MSVLTNTSAFPGALCGEIGDTCAYCKKSTKMERAVVTWRNVAPNNPDLGDDFGWVDITLHPSCALEWAAHLTSDATIAHTLRRSLPPIGSQEQRAALIEDANRWQLPGDGEQMFARYVAMAAERRAEFAARKAERERLAREAAGVVACPGCITDGGATLIDSGQVLCELCIAALRANGRGRVLAENSGRVS